MIDDVLHDIPREYRQRYQELLERPLMDQARLRGDVESYLATVRQVSAMVKLFDMSTAERLANVSLALLDQAKAQPETARKLAQAAVLYFILEEDDDEITGVLGFDDDIQVLNAVSRVLGREDLVVPVPSDAQR